MSSANMFISLSEEIAVAMSLISLVFSSLRHLQLAFEIGTRKGAFPLVSVTRLQLCIHATTYRRTSAVYGTCAQK